MSSPNDRVLDAGLPTLRSFVASANDSLGDFPIQNLPFGMVDEQVAVRIGDMVLTLSDALDSGALDLDAIAGGDRDARIEVEIAIVHGENVGDIAVLPALVRSRLRGHLAWLLAEDSPERARIERVLRPVAKCVPCVPFRIGDYTDFYASLHHATNVGSMFRPTNPLLPNWKHIPIGYHGRASSIVPSGTPVVRPHGQTVASDDGPPSFGPAKLIDYELEVGFFVAKGNALGTTIDIKDAWKHIFGFVLVNDWSARDIQKWEYQPLGPFLSKNFGTTVSPWVVTTEALAPFMVPGPARGVDDPQPLPYLTNPADRNIDITLEVFIESAAMRNKGIAPTLVSRGSFRDMFWTPAQMLTHHASNGCNMATGDLLASGTVSGATKDSRGCLLERTWRGAEPIMLGDGTERKFLQDGDEVVMRGYCERPGYPRIGFGECRGVLLAAR
jgi:fumarylacetoacetase